MRFSDIHGVPLKEHTITIKLMAGKFLSSGKERTEQELAQIPPHKTDMQDKLYSLRFVLKEGQVPQVENYGTPTLCETADQAILGGDAKVDGVMGPQDACHQRFFHVVVSQYISKLDIINN